MTLSLIFGVSVVWLHNLTNEKGWLGLSLEGQIKESIGGMNG